MRALLILSLCLLPLSAAADAAPQSNKQLAPSPAFLGPGGILPASTVALVAKADGELSFFPSLFVGWRVGLGGHVDLGLEAGGLHTAALGRLHLKARLFESESRRWFFGLRLRVELKRHEQDFGDAFVIDDWGLTFVPELSLGWRLGRDLRHVVYWAGYYYYDVDLRSDHEVEHYVLPALLGYEHRFDGGLHLGADLGVFFQLFNAETEGLPIPRIRLMAGYVF